eukprot:g9982.t1
MLSAARFATATPSTAWRAGRRLGSSSPRTISAFSEARYVSSACSWTGDEKDAGGVASTPTRVVEKAAAGKCAGASARGTIASRASPPLLYARAARLVLPLRGSKGRRDFGSSAAGCGPASCGEGAIVSGARTGGNVGSGGSIRRRFASTHVVSRSAVGGESSRDFTTVQDGAETYLVASRRLEAGCVLFDRVEGSLCERPTRHSVQVREGLHLIAEGDLIFMNHSCDPNCQLEVVYPALATTHVLEKDLPFLRVTVRATEIREDQLLTIDYNAMELDMSCPFDCRCGADNCRGRVVGFANLPRAAQKEYTSAPTVSLAGEKPKGPPPLTGAVRAWAKEANLPGA